jgi:ribosomal protein S18 acetylase RimI-like enzyme
MLNENLIWRIEDACLKAWPALHEKIIDGWLLRFAHGLTRRSNSANPLRSTLDATDALIAACETEYRERGLPVYFRIPSIVSPAMPARLNQLGYRSEGESLVLHADFAEATAQEDAAVLMMSHPTEEWFSTMARLQKHDQVKAGIYRRIVGSIKARAAFAGLRHEGRMVALAYGVLHDGLLCLESVITDEYFRGQGYARRTLRALFAYARRSATGGPCLQVQADNTSALALYKNLGLREVYRYHYQKKEVTLNS